MKPVYYSKVNNTLYLSAHAKEEDVLKGLERFLKRWNQYPITVNDVFMKHKWSCSDRTDLAEYIAGFKEGM